MINLRPGVFRVALVLWVTGILFVGSRGFVNADQPADGRNGRAEVRFLEGMIDHHQMAVDMNTDCLKKAVTVEVKTLCTSITTAQAAEITQMQSYLLKWYNIAYNPVSMYDTPMDPMTGMDHSGMGGANSDPAMMMGMMAGLGRLQGVAYEIAWVESMIDHHDDALHMSERILTRARHPELKALAENIIAAQTREVADMETLLTKLGAK